MTETTLPLPTINTALYLMAGMSPRVKEGLELESYRESADQDEASDQYILEDAFLSLNRDLLEIGCIIDADSSQIVEQPDKLHEFLRVVTYLLPSTLYSLIKSNEQIRTCVGHLVTGSLGNGETLIQTYLSELGGLDGQEALVPDLSEILDYYYPVISQTEAFTDYLKNLYFLVEQERFAVETDPESHTLYREKVKELVGRFSDVINNLSHHFLYDELCRIQNIFIKDLVAPDNFIEYNYLLTTDVDTLPEAIKDLHGKTFYHYTVSHPWCLDYYQVRKLVPSPAQIMTMYAFLYAIFTTEEDYFNARQKLAGLYNSPDIINVVNNLYKG